MLPAFVIGLREGLETVVILGAIALFLIDNDRRDRLRTVRIASGAAAARCLAVAIVLRVVQLSLSAIGDVRVRGAAVQHGVCRTRRAPVAQNPVPSKGLSDRRFLLRNTSQGADYGRLALVAKDNPSGPRMMASMWCYRVDFEGGVGHCLDRPASGLDISTTATVFDAHFKRLHQIALSGLPSRARVSSDGRYGSVTTFVTGDS